MELKVRRVKADDVFGDYIRVYWRHRPCVAAGRLCCAESNGRTVVGIARNAESGIIGLDNFMRLRLGVNEGQRIDVVIKKATQYQALRWALNASNPVVRVASWLAILSIGLGVVGIGLGAVSLFVAFADKN
ncbi:MAG: hypothetical protein WD044_04485 [Dongiaceae bacterium]